MGDVPFDKILTDTIFVWITVKVGCIMLTWCGELQLCFLWKFCIDQNVHQVYVHPSVYQQIVCGDLLAQIFVLCFHVTFNVNCIFKKICTGWDFDHHECSSLCPWRKSWTWLG